MSGATFEWDDEKNRANQAKHGVSLELAQHAFAGQRRVIVPDLSHGGSERRFFCIDEVEGGVLTVRFTWRDERIRIIGAGYWRKGRRVYEEENR